MFRDGASVQRAILFWLHLRRLDGAFFCERVADHDDHIQSKSEIAIFFQSIKCDVSCTATLIFLCSSAMQYACIHAKNTPFATILLSPVMLSIAPGKNVKHIFLQGVTMVSQTVTACLAACAKSPWLGGLRYFVARQTQRDSPGQPQETQTHQTQHHMLTSPLTHDKCETNQLKLATHG